MNPIEANVRGLVKTFNVSNRGMDEGSHTCKYLTAGGNSCLVGSMLTKDALAQWSKLEKTYASFSVFQAYNHLEHAGELTPSSWMDTQLKDAYKGIPLPLMVDLQLLHDKGSNWNADGLSKSGEGKLNEFLRDYYEP